VSSASAGAPTIGPRPAAGPVQANAVVEHVVDGDTIDVRLGSGAEERVRLIGIDTPESKKPDTPVECFALEAAAGTARLLPVGTPVRLEQDVEARDRYGRLLAYVLRSSDGLFVNLELARAGYAGLLTYPPNVAHTDEFVTAVAAARAAGVGLWARCESSHEPG
jgi:micrococcal nuclease